MRLDVEASIIDTSRRIHDIEASSGSKVSDIAALTLKGVDKVLEYAGTIANLHPISQVSQ